MKTECKSMSPQSTINTLNHLEALIESNYNNLGFSETYGKPLRNPTIQLAFIERKYETITAPASSDQTVNESDPDFINYFDAQKWNERVRLTDSLSKLWQGKDSANKAELVKALLFNTLLEDEILFKQVTSKAEEYLLDIESGAVGIFDTEAE